MKYRAMLVFFLILMPCFSFAQKAYESIDYNGQLNGNLIQLTLGNGFICASKINTLKKGIIHTYWANSGHPDAANTMLFQSKYLQIMDYFVLTNIQESYNTLPRFITGKYYKNKKAVAVEFKLKK